MFYQNCSLDECFRGNALDKIFDNFQLQIFFVDLSFFVQL